MLADYRAAAHRVYAYFVFRAFAPYRVAVVLIIQRIAENRVNTVCKHYCRARWRVQLLVVMLFYYFNIKAVAEYRGGFFCKRRHKVYAERHIKCKKYRYFFRRRAYFFGL